MEPSDELRELIRQVTEHLRYCCEIGITHLSEPPQVAPVSSSARAAQLSSDRRADSSNPRVGINEALTPEPQAASPLRREPQPAPMTKSINTGTAPSLFGDLAAPAVEEEFANETLEDIRAEMGDCQRCKLWKTRTKLVFGEGNPKAELMFVGEAPGADEDRTGRPFVGRAGQLLTKMIEAIGMKREEVYIANVIKSRPPGNRDPEKDEVEACSPFLFRQIAAIRPRLIVTLGNPATQALLSTRTGISRMRGEFQDYPRIAGIKVLPTFHPAYLLRSPDKKREAWEDLKKVRAFLRGEIQA